MVANRSTTARTANNLTSVDDGYLTWRSRDVPQQREHPYIWATWLPRLLTGENSCEWAIWFKAHHQNWAKPLSDFNQAEWLVRHTKLLKQQRREW